MKEPFKTVYRQHGLGLEAERLADGTQDGETAGRWHGLFEQQRHFGYQC